ncbi:MAG: TetR/AcrR family transcriptional regulator [Acidimicrobiales bacterium]|nr:TetR/AcrR family transcriptional regulator [Acidimicrobiales bacterium]
MKDDLQLNQAQNIRSEARLKLRDAILDSARNLAIDRGWSDVRMGQIASAVGISRQSLYTEFGDKEELGKKMVIRESSRFFDGIRAALNAHPTDLVAAVQSAVELTLREAYSDPLLHSILTNARGGDSSLIRSLTTESAPILNGASEVILNYVRSNHPLLPEDLVLDVVDSIIRLTVSHLVLPVEEPEIVAKRLARLTALVVNASVGASVQPEF